MQVGLCTYSAGRLGHARPGTIVAMVADARRGSTVQALGVILIAGNFYRREKLRSVIYSSTSGSSTLAASAGVVVGFPLDHFRRDFAFDGLNVGGCL